MTLYHHLKHLADTNDGFYYTDQVNQSGTRVRIFGYRIASEQERKQLDTVLI